jgi:hypothetical protein
MSQPGLAGTQVVSLAPATACPRSVAEAAGLDPAATRGTLDLDLRSGSLDAVRGNGIAVSDTLADDGGVKLGPVLQARMADATPARLRVVAIYHRANGIGDIVLPRERALAHAVAALDSSDRSERRSHRAALTTMSTRATLSWSKAARTGGDRRPSSRRSAELPAACREAEQPSPGERQKRSNASSIVSPSAAPPRCSNTLA